MYNGVGRPRMNYYGNQGANRGFQGQTFQQNHYGGNRPIASRLGPSIAKPPPQQQPPPPQKQVPTPNQQMQAKNAENQKSTQVQKPPQQQPTQPQQQKQANQQQPPSQQRQLQQNQPGPQKQPQQQQRQQPQQQQRQQQQEQDKKSNAQQKADISTGRQPTILPGQLMKAVQAVTAGLKQEPVSPGQGQQKGPSVTKPSPMQQTQANRQNNPSQSQQQSLMGKAPGALMPDPPIAQFNNAGGGGLARINVQKDLPNRPQGLPQGVQPIDPRGVGLPQGSTAMNSVPGQNTLGGMGQGPKGPSQNQNDMRGSAKGPQNVQGNMQDRGPYNQGNQGPGNRFQQQQNQDNMKRPGFYQKDDQGPNDQPKQFGQQGPGNQNRPDNRGGPPGDRSGRVDKRDGSGDRNRFGDSMKPGDRSSDQGRPGDRDRGGWAGNRGRQESNFGSDDRRYDQGQTQRPNQGTRYGGGNQSNQPKSLSEAAQGGYGASRRYAGPSGGQGNRPRGGYKGFDKTYERVEEISGPQYDLEPLDTSEKKFNATSRLFVGNLPRDITQDELKAIFSKYGELGQVYFNKEAAYAFINFDFHANAEKALRELNGETCKGRQMKVRFAAITTGVRVKNLSMTVTNELLNVAFSVFGMVESSRVTVDDRGKSTGEGIVVFSEKKSAVLAYKKCQEECFFLTGSLRPVIVEPLETRDEQEGFPETSITKNELYQVERKVGPRFATPDSVEAEYGERWKALYDLYNEKKKQLDQDLKAELDMLEAKMQLVVHHKETEILRKELAVREAEAAELQMGLAGVLQQSQRPSSLTAPLQGQLTAVMLLPVAT